MISNSCIVDTTYALALYLLYMPLPAIANTRYYVGSIIPHSFDEKLNHVVRFDTEALSKKISLLRFVATWIRCLFYRVVYISCTNVFGQDHIGMFGLLTIRKSYSLLEDSPGIFSSVHKTAFFISLHRCYSIFDMTAHLLRFGRRPNSCYGQSRFCINRIITSRCDVNSELLKNCDYELVDINSMWENSDIEKKNYIRHVFGLSDEILDTLSVYSEVFLTQPFREDCGLSDKEWRNIVDSIVVDKQKIMVIKVHPRDKFNYEKYFPGYLVLRLAIPMQLFTAIGLTFKRAFTISSSAIHAFPDSVEKIILGTGVDPKILAICGQQS